MSLMAFNSENDMLTFADFNLIRYIATSNSHVYFVTTEGIIRYNKLENKWEDPLTSSKGIDHRDIFRIWVEQFDEELVVQTSDSYYEYEQLFDIWFPISEFPQIELNYEHIRLRNIMYPPIGYNFSGDGYLIDSFGRDFQFTDIVDDKSGNTWLGTWGFGASTAGTISAIIELLPFGLLQNQVNTIFNDDGFLIIGGLAGYSQRSGITIFNPDDNSFSYIETGPGLSLPSEDINCIEADDEFIYIGTTDGLYMWNREYNDIEKIIKKSNGLPDDIILSLQKLGDTILVGTVGGLSYIFSNGDSLGYIRPNQFINNDIYDFELTDSTLWIASSSGAYQYHLKTKDLQKFQDPHLIVFDRAYKIEKSGNKLWFASDAGYVSLDLETGETRPYQSLARNSINRALAVNEDVAAIASEHGFKLIYHKRKHILEREFTTNDGLPSSEVNCLLFDGDFLWIGTDKGLTQFLWNNPFRVD